MENSKEHFQQLNIASKRIRKIRSFYKHITAYLLLNTSLLIIWLADDITHPIFWTRTFFITAGLGLLGVIGHGITIMDLKYLLPRWEEKKIKELINKDKPQANS